MQSVNNNYSIELCVEITSYEQVKDYSFVDASVKVRPYSNGLITDSMAMMIGKKWALNITNLKVYAEQAKYLSNFSLNNHVGFEDNAKDSP